MRVIHWFRNDLRLDDNVALRAAAAMADELLPVFILDPALIRAAPSSPRVRFVQENVTRLAAELEARGSGLVIRIGDPRKLLVELAREVRADRVVFNRDTSPYALRRDAAVEEALDSAGVDALNFKDRVILESSEVRTQKGEPFAVFTPYSRVWRRQMESLVQPPEAAPERLPPLMSGVEPGALLDVGGASDVGVELPATGEVAALERLRSFLEWDVEHYHERRNTPGLPATSRLSPYLRFGVLSPRRALAEAEELASARPQAREGVEAWTRQLIWRDFYAAVLAENPHVLSGAHKREFDALEWENDEGLFEAWCRGETGFPLVDAGMRELNATGYMHNRTRMVVASFLVKDLLVDWRWGERYFMDRLVDGDPANNNGGWQWSASTGTDAQPYFRIFNPVLQSQRYDPEGLYIRRWVPELESVSASLVHQPWKAPLQTAGYPSPIVDHAERRDMALARFEAVRKTASRIGSKESAAAAG